MYTTLLQLTNCQTILRARIKFYGSLTKRIESQNHQSMYNCSFPTFFSMWSPKLPTATWPQGVLGLLLFFFLRINWKTLQKPSTSWSPPGRSQALQMLMPPCCCFQSHVLMKAADQGRKRDHKARLVDLVFSHMKGRTLCQVSPAHQATWTCESTVCWEAKLLK